MISAKPAPRYSARGTRSRQLRWLIPPTAVDEIDPCLVAGPDYELVDVDVARPGRDEGDAVSDVLSAERDDALVDRLRTSLVAPEADQGEVRLTMPGSISVTRTGRPRSSILRTSVRARSAALAAL